MNVQTAIVQNALDVAQIFKDNMSLGRKLPQQNRLTIDPIQPAKPEPITVKLETNHPLATATANAPAAAALPPQATAPVDGKQNWLRNAALLGAIGLGGGGLGWLASFLSQPSGPTINVQQGEEGLLNYLQEKGFHLQPEQPK